MIYDILTSALGTLLAMGVAALVVGLVGKWFD